MDTLGWDEREYTHINTSRLLRGSVLISDHLRQFHPRTYYSNYDYLADKIDRLPGAAGARPTTGPKDCCRSQRPACTMHCEIAYSLQNGPSSPDLESSWRRSI